MSDTTKRVVFEGVDMVSGALKSMTKNEREFFQTSLDLGAKFSQTSSGVLKFVNQEIEARKQLLEITKKQKIATTEAYYESEKKGRKGSVLDEIEATKRGKISGIEAGTKKEQDQLEALKKINETLVTGFQRTIAEDRDTAKKWFETIQKKGGAGLSAEDKLKFKVYQEYFDKEKKPEDEKKKSNFWPTLWGTMGGNMIAKALDRAGGMAGAQTGEFALAQLMSALPIGGGLLSTVYGAHFSAAMAGQIGRKRYQSIAGRGQDVSGVPYGMASSETGQLGAELALQRGSSTNLGGRLLDQMALEKAFGLDRGTLFKLSKGERFGGGTAMSGVTGLIKDFGKEVFKGGDMARMPELLELQIQIQEQQLDALGRIDSKSARGILGSMVELGQKYSMNPKYMQGLQGALESPGNEWQRARQLSVLSRLRPGSSLWELNTMMQGGLSTPGYMTGVMKSITQTAGSGEGRKWLLSNMLSGRGWKNTDIDNLISKMDKDPNLFNKVGFGDVEKDILNVRGKGRDLTSPYAVKAAAIQGAYEAGPWTGFGEVMSQAGDAFSTAVADFTVAIAQLVSGKGGNKYDEEIAEKKRKIAEIKAKIAAAKINE